MSTWLWPVPNHSTITSGVGPRWGREHKGIDISAPIGTTVVATRAGRVSSIHNSCTHNYGKPDAKDPSGCGGGYGNFIYLDHGDGYISRYAHLTNASVKLGDNVTAGQLIGTVGTTGDSTGPHLHFEIRLNGVVQDPESYVSPGNTVGSIVQNIGNISQSISGIVSSIVQSTIDPPLVVVGRRVSELSSQPLHAYVQISIGDKPLSDKPQYMQDFEITRYMGAGDTASFTVFDDSWSYIEKDFANNWSNVKIKYGYAGGVSSAVYNMQLTDYSLTFNSTGTFISVDAISHGTVENIKQTTIMINTKNPTEAVKEICRFMGWVVIPENFDSTEDVVGDINLSVLNDFPVTHIIENILPLSRTIGGKEILNFYLDSHNVAYFKSEEFMKDVPVDSIRTYIFQKGYDSPIIDLTFNIKGKFGGTSKQSIASGIRTSVFDNSTKKEISYKEDIKSVVTSATGETVSMQADQSIPSIDSAGYDAEIAKARLYYDVKKDMTEHYEATMTIVGDPTISLFDNIRIINVTDDGYLHHTSGIYMIKGIIDHVSGGSMTTTLNLVRNGAGLVESGLGVEVISPKVLVK